MGLTVKGLRAVVTAEGVSATGRPFTVPGAMLREGEALVALLLLGASVPGGSNRSKSGLASPEAREARAYVGAVVASLLRAGVPVPGEGLTARREALRALSAPSVLIPGSLIPEAGGKNETARVSMAVFRDGVALWERVWEEEEEAPGIVRAVRDGDLWRVFLSAT